MSATIEKVRLPDGTTLPANTTEIGAFNTHGEVCTVYMRDGAVVITGNPPSNEDEETGHNCDAMGCGWEHVLFRGPVDATLSATRAELEENARHGLRALASIADAFGLAMPEEHPERETQAYCESIASRVIPLASATRAERDEARRERDEARQEIRAAVLILNGTPVEGMPVTRLTTYARQAMDGGHKAYEERDAAVSALTRAKAEAVESAVATLKAMLPTCTGERLYAIEDAILRIRTLLVQP